MIESNVKFGFCLRADVSPNREISCFKIYGPSHGQPL